MNIKIFEQTRADIELTDICVFTKVEFRYEKPAKYTVRQSNLHKLVHEQAQSIQMLHGSVICHMNGNFVGFQNMCDFKSSDN